MNHVKTYKGDNGKWYVEVTGLENYNDHVKIGWRLNARDGVNSADFVPPTSENDCGFKSRQLARQYIRAYQRDCSDLVGGLH